MERDRSRYIAQVKRPGVAMTDRSKPGGLDLDLEKSMDMTVLHFAAVTYLEETSKAQQSTVQNSVEASVLHCLTVT